MEMSREELVKLYEPEFKIQLDLLHKEMDDIREKYKKGKYTYGNIPQKIVNNFMKRRSKLFNNFYKAIGDMPIDYSSD